MQRRGDRNLDAVDGRVRHDQDEEGRRPGVAAGGRPRWAAPGTRGDHVGDPRAPWSAVPAMTIASSPLVITADHRAAYWGRTHRPPPSDGVPTLVDLSPWLSGDLLHGAGGVAAHGRLLEPADGPPGRLAGRGRRVPPRVDDTFRRGPGPRPTHRAPRTAVLESTEGQQRPHEYGSLLPVSETDRRPVRRADQSRARRARPTATGLRHTPPEQPHPQ